MFLLIWLVISLVTGALAARKGYSFILWALAAGIIGLIILALLPFANKSDQQPEEPTRLKQTGNAVAGVLAAVGIGLLVVKLL